jgi:ABC-type transport system involved in multi-copper enzyme maturation permease subunit
MMALIAKEMRMTMRSLVFYVFILVTCFFYFTSYATEETWGELSPPSATEPQNMGSEEHPYYGWRKPENTFELATGMRSVVGGDLDGGTIEKLRLGFLVNVKLDEEEKKTLSAALSRLDEILRKPDNYAMEEVFKVADELNAELGGNSMYRRGMNEFGLPIETYEEAVKALEQNRMRYLEKVEAGQLLPGAARYFSDYLSLPAGIFPVFLSAFLLLRDRSSRMSELIYSRRVSCWTYVFSKFIALGVMLSLVYLALACLGAWTTVRTLELDGQTGAAMASFLEYTAWWILPTIWFSVAFGLFGSMLFRRGIVPVALQIVWWFVSVLPLMGSYGLYRLFIRFNSPDDYDLYSAWADDIALNRGFYLILAVLLTAGAAWLWERNRSREASGMSFRRASARKASATEAAR